MEGGRTAAAAAAPGAAGGAPPPTAGEQPRFFLRLEYISERTTRVVLAAQRVGMLVCLAILILLVLAQYSDDSSSLTRDQRLEALNLAVASCCLLLLGGSGAFFARRVWVARRAGTRWGPRRTFLLASTGIDLTLQLINAAVYLASNIISLQVKCAWLSHTVDGLFLVSSSLWNTLLLLNTSRPLLMLPAGAWHRLRLRWAGRGALRRCAARCCCCAGDATPAADASTHSQHQPLQPMKLDLRAAAWAHVAMVCLLWVPAEVIIFGTTLSALGRIGGSDEMRLCVDPACTQSVKYTPALLSQPPWNTLESCTDLTWDCTVHPLWSALSLTVGACLLLYGVLFLALSAWLLLEYARLPYGPNRALNVVARLQLRTRGFITAFFLLALSLVLFVNIDSCNANLELWLGLAPMHLAMSLLLAEEAFLFSPSTPKLAAVKLHTLLQRFAWTEAEAATVQQQRGLPDEPLFCFETALRACYLCMHTYRHFKASPESTVSSLATAMALYGCGHHEWLRCPEHDMHCLLMWGPHALVVAFRGTQSMKNVRADAKFWRSPHPPRRGTLWLGTRPLVHTGFLDAWCGAGLDGQVLQRVREVLQGQAHDSLPPFATTVVRCCSAEHEGLGAEIAAAAAAAREAEAAAEADLGSGDSAEEAAEAAAELLRLFSLGAGGTVNGTAGDMARSASLFAAFDEGGDAAGAACGAGGAPGPQQQQQQVQQQAQPQQQQQAQQAQQQAQQQRPFRILVTGHSLGGAVGTLCAFDIARRLPEWGFTPALGSGAAAAGPAAAGAPAAAAAEPPGAASQHRRPVSLSMYSFGAPRTGNHAFAAQYGDAVPDTWALVNGQDLVAKEGKLLCLFKRPGSVALINPAGDLVVRPSFLEHRAHRSSVRSSVAQHLLTAYNTSLAAVLRRAAAQHEGKGFSGGPQAMALLAANPATRELLVRPLAIRPQSLRRYLGSAGAAAAAAPGPALDTPDTVEVVVEAPASGPASGPSGDGTAGGAADGGTRPGAARRLAANLGDLVESIFRL